MEYINLNQYINKQTGDILEAIDWNNLHMTLLSKINEIVDSYNQLGTKIELVNLELNFLKTEITPGAISVGNIAEKSTIEKDLISVVSTAVGGQIKSSIAPTGIEVYKPGNLGSGSSSVNITPGEINLTTGGGTLNITTDGISKETEGGTLKIDSKHNALWLHGGSDSSILDGQDVTVGAGNKITLNANNGVEIISSRIDLLSDAIGVNGDNGITQDVPISTSNGSGILSFKNGILIGFTVTENNERPVDLEDIDENQ